MVEYLGRNARLQLESQERTTFVNSDHIVSVSDDFIIVDTTGADVSIVLPFPINGRRLVVSNFEGTNDVILTCSEDINGAAGAYSISPGNTVSLKALTISWLVW